MELETQLVANMPVDVKEEMKKLLKKNVSDSSDMSLFYNVIRL